MENIYNKAFLDRYIYEPSCSHYAEEAIETYEAIEGIFLPMKRLLR